MNHLEEHLGRLLPSHQIQTVSKEQQVLTTLILLFVGYYALSFFDLWPATIKRFLYESTIRIIPAAFVHALQNVMVKLGRMSPEEAALFGKENHSDSKRKEEAIHRVLGRTPIPSAINRARTLSGFDKLKQAVVELGPPGLGNWDNSCYQNSVLQGLASLPAFHDYIYRSLQLCQRSVTDSRTTEALVSFLGKLADADHPSQTIWTPAALKSMDSWQQQDAQEYFSKISDAVEKEAIQYTRALRKRLSPGFSSLPADGPGVLNKTEASRQISTAVQAYLETIVSNPLGGLQAQALECQTCGFSEGISLTQFECLTLSLGSGGTCYLEELLDAYTEPELIEGVECDQCTKNANISSEGDVGSTVVALGTAGNAEQKRKQPVLRTKAKQLTIGRLPKDLILHINRSIFDDFGNQRKNTAFIQFPARLDFRGRWCAPIDDEEDATAAVYELKCIVTHSGRHDNGHYVAYGQRDKDWYSFNDEIVTKLTEEEVLRRGNVFMLFYEALDPVASSFAKDDTSVQGDGLAEAKQATELTDTPDDTTVAASIEPVVVHPSSEISNDRLEPCPPTVSPSDRSYAAVCSNEPNPQPVLA